MRDARGAWVWAGCNREWWAEFLTWIAVFIIAFGGLCVTSYIFGMAS